MNKSIAKNIAKKISKYPHTVHWVFAARYVCEKNGYAATRWVSSASHDALTRKLNEWQPALDNEIILAETTRHKPSPPPKPRNAVERASIVRKLLRQAWSEHVKGGPCEGKKQCFDVVRRGQFQPFPWWEAVVGSDVPFESASIDIPKVSERLFGFLISRMQ